MLYNKIKIPKDQYIITGDGSAILCPPKQQTGHERDSLLEALAFTGNALSISLLALTFGIYSFVHELRSVPGKMLMNYIAALFLGQIFLQFNKAFLRWEIACKMVGGLLHYLWLSTFSWLNAMTFRMLKTFSSSAATDGSDGRELAVFMVFSWGLPSIIVVPCILLDVLNTGFFLYGGDVNCWIDQNKPNRVLYSFALPLVFFILTNAAMMLRCAIVLKSSFQATSIVNPLKKKQLLKVYFRLFITMGFTWLIGLLSDLTGIEEFDYPFVVINSLQGVYVF